MWITLFDEKSRPAGGLQGCPYRAFAQGRALWLVFNDNKTVPSWQVRNFQEDR
jgi:hypothetical protein